MKTTKEEILKVSLNLFAERGYDAVSTSMIAENLGITKGALYVHFKDKQDIFDSIVQKMFELDKERAEEDRVPAGVYEETPDEYKNTELREFCEYAIKQFDFWTGDEFAVSFRRMITLEQFKSPEKMKLYQDVIAKGPVKYTEDIFGEMLKKGKLSKAAKEMGALKLALELFAPLSLSIQLFDGGEDPKRLRKDLKVIIDGFRKRYTA